MPPIDAFLTTPVGSVCASTAANAQIAEGEWNRVAPAREKRGFSAAPSLSVRPTGAGISVVLRYVTRANERFEVRARIYRAVVDLLRKKQIPEAAITSAPPAEAKPATSKT